MIYEKTSLGLEEISGNTRSLNLRERQVLIMADGHRDESVLVDYFKKAETKDILLSLLSRGYIRAKQNRIFANTNLNPISNASKTTTTPQLEAKPLPLLNEADLANIKEIIVKSTDCYLGIMGRPIKQKLEHANSIEKLKPIISEWHMALRDSKKGKEFAATLLHEAEHIIFKQLDIS